MGVKNNSRILIIPDLHEPYSHPDSLKFLKWCKKKYKPTRIISIGDEIDAHALSYHESDPDLDNAGRELEKAKKYLRPIMDLFPVMDIVESNHGSMIYRKAKSAGIPREAIKNYKEILGAPQGWHWYPDLKIKIGKQEVLFCHGIGANVLNASKDRGVSLVQGHYHSKLCLHWHGTQRNLKFAMNVGSLVNDRSMAMAYGKNFAKRPLMGCGLIINGVPQLIPMFVNKRHRMDMRV